MKEETENKKREEFVIQIGPILKQVLELQKEKIKEVSWGCVNASYYEAGEVIAKKIMENKLV